MTRRTLPFWSWPNLISLDAVAIGLVWQAAFAVAFCGRAPGSAENAIIGLTIWIAYTADRLLDSFRLDLSRPHTLRHRIHFQWRPQIGALWIAAVAVDGVLVFTNATESQLRCGCGAIAAVLAYGGSVHFIGDSRRWIPKELQAGIVFAIGISLLAWSETDHRSQALLLSTLMSGLLFAANCFAVACCERKLDASQGFASWPNRYPASAKWLPTALAAHLICTALLFAFGQIPELIAACLAVGNIFLSAAVIVHRAADRKTSATPATGLFGLFADAAMVLPPAAWMTVGITL